MRASFLSFTVFVLLLVPAKSFSLETCEEITEEFNSLLTATPELAPMLNVVLSLLPETSFWHSKTSDDMAFFFCEWLSSNPQPENPGRYIRLFDELANSNGGYDHSH